MAPLMFTGIETTVLTEKSKGKSLIETVFIVDFPYFLSSKTVGKETEMKDINL